MLNVLIFVAALVTRVVGACHVTDVQVGMNHGGQDLTHFGSESAAACQQRCCDDIRCGAFTWTSYQPRSSSRCSQGTACCWLKSHKVGAFATKENCTSGEVVSPAASLMSPRLTEIAIIANDTTGNLRDPSGMIRDDKTGKWHFWVVYIPGQTTPGWGGFLQHWSSDSIEGPWTNKGIALNHSSDPAAWDYHGLFSPSALYDEEDDRWYLFYSATAANYTTEDPLSAQLVASALSPDGPWTRLGVVTSPTGSDLDHFNQTWNGRRCDSGRALRINGARGYWTKGCRNDYKNGHTCAEGAYFPKDASSFKPPYTEWASNPIFEADGSAGFEDRMGYENCEFFLGPNGEVEGKRLLHVLCNGHTTGVPHFIADPTNLHWTFLEMLSSTGSAGEPTPVYHGGMPGDEANVTHFIARTGGSHLVVGLYKLDWVPLVSDESVLVV